MSWTLSAMAALLLTPYVWRVLVWKANWDRIEQADNAGEATDSMTGQTSQLSVIIPVRDEAANLPGLLDDLARQVGLASQVGALQILVVDDHSQDRTAEIVGRWPGIELVVNDGEGKKAAIATGMRRAVNDWVATLDGDVRVGQHWASAVCRAVEQSSDARMLIGPVALSPADKTGVQALQTCWAQVQSLDYAAMMGWAAATAAGGKPEMASGANLVFRRADYPTLDRIQPGVPSGDDAFALEAVERQHGAAAICWIHDRDAIARTAGAPDLSSWWQQRLRWGGKARHYKSARVKTTAAIVLGTALLQLGLLGWLACAITGTGAWAGLKIAPPAIAWTAVLIAKAATDCAFVRPVAKWFGLQAGHKSGVWAALILLHPLMIVLPGLAGFVQRPSWKGRKI
jgi:hypothetical protein